MEKLNCKGLYTLKEGQIKPFELDNKKTIMCGIPGAFTSGCTKKHLPGFAKNLNKLKEKGVEKVLFVGNNDVYVMNEWNMQHGSPEIITISDPLAVFTKSIKKDEDWGDSFGIRTSRYVFLIEDGCIVKEFKNPFIEGVLEEI
jgi:peroxiredoxin